MTKWMGLTIAACIACSAPDDVPQVQEPVAKVEEEFSARGIERLIPLRIIQWKAATTDPDVATPDKVGRSVYRANAIYRDAGVQFYVKSIESIVSNFGTNPPRGFYDVNTPGDPAQHFFTWAQVRSSLQAALPNLPSNAWSDSTSSVIWSWLMAGWNNPNSSSEAEYVPIFVYQVSTGGCVSGFPWNGNGVSMGPGSCWDDETLLAHELGHTLGLTHVFEGIAGIPDPETGGALVEEDHWDLIHGAGGDGSPPALFASKSQALAFPGLKYLKNAWLGPNQDNCSVGPAPTCSLTCQLFNNHNSRDLFTDGAPLDGTMRFTLAAANEHGSNVMSYAHNAACPGRGITPSQAVLVRKYLRYDMMQRPGESGQNYIGTPNHVYHDVLGFRRTDPISNLDFDGDGKRDIGVYKPPTTLSGTGTFHVLLSSSGWFSGGALNVSFGVAGDVPVPADYDGDGRTDIAVYRTSGSAGTNPASIHSYWLYCPSNGSISGCASPVSKQFGVRQDVPLPGTDFDGDPSTGEVALFRPSTDTVYWTIEPFTTTEHRAFSDSVGSVVYTIKLDTDNKTDIVRYRMSTGTFNWLRSVTNWDTESTRTFTGSSRGSYPVRTRNSDGRDALTIYDPATSTFRTMWTPTSSNTITDCPYGSPGDTALGMELDFDGDQKSDRFLLRKPDASGNIRFSVRPSNTCSGEIQVVNLGADVSNRVVFFMGQDGSGDGKPDLYMLNTQTMQWKIMWSQFLLSGPVWTTINHGDSRDVPL